jgi:hypothetical protein
MPNDDTHGSPSTRSDATTYGAAVVAGPSRTDATGVQTATAGAGGPAFDRRRVAGSGR